MKKQMLKLTLLLLAIVFGEGSALAATTKHVNVGDGKWTEAEVAKWSNANLVTVGSKNYLELSVSQASISSTSPVYTFAADSKVSFETQIVGGNSCGDNDSYDYVTFGGISLRIYNEGKKVSLVVDEVERNLGAGSNGTYKINLEINQATGNVTYTVTGKIADAAGAVTSTTPLSTVEFGHVTATKDTKDVTVRLKSLKISEVSKPSTVKLSLSTAEDFTYSTFCPDYDVDFTKVTTVEAYQASVNNNVVSLTQVTGKVKAGEGLLIKNVNHVASVSIPVTTDATALDGNNLRGVKYEMSAADFTGKTAYILASDTEFQRITDASKNKLAKGKAYLDCTAEAGAKPSSLFFGEATGINGVAVEKKADNAIYNLQGMRVKTPTKGLYIINGKKYRF